MNENRTGWRGALVSGMSTDGLGAEDETADGHAVGTAVEVGRANASRIEAEVVRTGSIVGRTRPIPSADAGIVKGTGMDDPASDKEIWDLLNSGKIQPVSHFVK